MSVEAGHQYGNEAELCIEQGDFKGATEAHYKAAEEYLKAISEAKDPEAIKTLKLLYTNHTRQARDLQRRANATEQKAEEPKPSFEKSPEDEQQQEQEQQEEEQHDSPDTETSEEDPFDKFWDNLERVVDKMGAPIAFASAPIQKAHQKQPEATRNRALSQPAPSRMKTLEEYHEENHQLKQTIDFLTRRLESLKKVQDENQLLKSSIIHFKQEFQKVRRVDELQALQARLNEAQKEIKRLREENERLRRRP